MNQKLAVRLLEKRGHSVAVAANGIEALERLAKQRFDIVLMDVQMPGMDGLEATAAIRDREGQTGCHVPIVAMTARAMKGDRERCLEAGMDAYVAKPLLAAELFETVERIAAPPGSAERVATDGESAGGVPSSPSPGPPGAQSLPPGFDYAEALQHVDGDEQLLAELLAAFSAECPVLVGTIRDSIERAEARDLERAAHTLKGAVRVLGARDAVTATEQLEMMGRRGELQEAPAVYAQLRDALRRS